MEKLRVGPAYRVIVIGGSAGALDVLFSLLPALRRDFPHAIVIVLHRKGSDDGSLAKLLAIRSGLPVREIEDKDDLSAGSVFLAPPDYHLLFEADGGLSLDDSEKVAYSRPSIDVALGSAADAYGERVTALLLSGANADGADGMMRVRACGGVTIAQLPASAAVPFMPQQAISNGAAKLVYDVAGIVRYLNELDGTS